MFYYPCPHASNQHHSHSYRLGGRCVSARVIQRRSLSGADAINALRPFYFAVHPDFFGQHPRERVMIFK